MASLLHPPVLPEPGTHPTAVIDASARVAATAYVGAQAVIEAGAVIGDYAAIGPGCFVGPNCRIDDYTRLHANVTFVRNVVVGKRCIFHSGCVVGSDGFGNALTPEGWIKVPQLGGVRIGDDVEIGSCTSVDCGAIDDTVIGNGVRLDNQIQIGHNVQIGEHTAIAASCAIAGSAIVGKRCMFAGMVGMAGHIEVCDDVIVNGKGMISKDITEPGAYASNFPIDPVREWNRNVAMVRRLGKLTERVSKLEKGSK